MSQLQLLSGHQEAKEITPIGTWILTRLMLATAGIMLPLAIGYVLS